ncbi:hypothetical protein PORY_001466 [Pneumocystis oryctolagi]|uniref:Uncharacterized protein n=1 Tax=Pneumocystis oryctolagi TaxID=42067 RepID=A0ACB7CC02_9ASCO|nr:hypothetical protein PORY_001466 [Pneumocystis oryctolagi]
MYDYSMNRHKQLYGLCKHQSYGNMYYDSCGNYENNEHVNSYSDEQMPCKRRPYADETYGMRHVKIQKDHVNYIQVVSTPGNNGYPGEKQLYYNNYQIKVPEFIDKDNSGRKQYVNNMKNSSYWDRIYPCSSYSRDTCTKWMYSGNAGPMWGFSDIHLPHRRPNPRHFGSVEHLNKKVGYPEQIALYNRDAPCHRYPLSEPNDIPWGVPMRRIRNNISMPNIGSQFKRQNDVNYFCRPYNIVDPLHCKANFTNFSVPKAAIKRSMFGVGMPNDQSNEDSISLFCDDSFSSCYEGKEIESPRVILSRSINNINNLAPHSVTENLYISNDIKVIDTKVDKPLYDSEKKNEHKNHKSECSSENSVNSHKKKQKKCKNSFDGLNSIYKYGIDKENFQKYKEKLKKSLSCSSESLLHKKSSQDNQGILLNSTNIQKSSLSGKDNDTNWPLSTSNESTTLNSVSKNNQKSSECFDSESNNLQTYDAMFMNNGKPNKVNGSNNDKNDLVYESRKSNKKVIDSIDGLKQEMLPIFSQFSSANNTSFQKTNKNFLSTPREKDYECKISNQNSANDLNKKIVFSDAKNLQNSSFCVNDPKTQLKYAKKLIQVASELSNDNLKDTKFIKKNKEKYLSDAYSIVKGLVNSNPPYPEAMFFLANCYGDGTLGLTVDHKQAYMLYHSASKYKHPQSIYRTGVCLEIGMGVKKNQEKAVQYYQRAASLGNVTAMYKMGIILLNGLLRQVKNPKKAIFWLNKASELADEENPHALHELAILYEKDNEGIVIRDEKYSLELYTRAAHLMYSPSQVRLAYAYEHGILGCEIDPKKSITWYSRAAEKGNPDAELGLSGWYLTGAEGVLEQSDREAYLWARKAAEKGLTKAEYVIGYYLEVGIGVKSNRVEAKTWYKRAAISLGKGLVRAIERLYELKKFGSKSKIPDKIYNRWQLVKMFDCSIL